MDPIDSINLVPPTSQTSLNMYEEIDKKCDKINCRSMQFMISDFSACN